MVAIKPEGGERADSLLVRPAEIIFVEVEISPVVADGNLQSVDGLENAVASHTDDGLHGNGVVACADAVAVVGADVFVAYGVFARVVCVTVGKS